MLNIATDAPFETLIGASGAPYIFVAAEHKHIVRNIFKRDGVEAVCEKAVVDGKTNLPVEYTFTFPSEGDAEVAVAALNAAPEPDDE